MSRDKKGSKTSIPAKSKGGSKSTSSKGAEQSLDAGSQRSKRVDGFNSAFIHGKRTGDKAPASAKINEKSSARPNRSKRRELAAIEARSAKGDEDAKTQLFPAKRKRGGGSAEKAAPKVAPDAVEISEVAQDDLIPVKLDEKLQKVLARVGLGSRREMEREITSGNVTVNGVKATLGDRVTDKDYIEFQGKKVKVIDKEDQRLRVILYNKPEGQICSRSDPEGRPSVYEGLPRLQDGRWISVGRLDFNTSGLLLFTNEGELANKLMHPSSNIDREYLVRIHGDVTDDMLDRLRAGVELDDGVAQFSDIKAGADEGSNHWFYCVVMEGKNREVRRLWESQGVKVSRLKRVRYGNIFIPSHVRVGQWVELNDKEISDLALTAGMSTPKKPRFSPKVEQTRERHHRKLRAAAGISKPNPRPKKSPRKTP